MNEDTTELMWREKQEQERQYHDSLMRAILTVSESNFKLQEYIKKTLSVLE